MTPCTATTGFFVLGRCGRPAVTQCRCGRPVCSRHVESEGLCSECAAAQGYADPYGRGWARGYRRRYYQDSSQQYQDPMWYSSFDSYDRDSFDVGGGFDYGDFDGGGGNDWVDS
jgi:hypothetical protein